MVISEKAHAECVRLLDLLTNKRVQESWSWVFMSPVTDIPGYHDIIKKPMDLGTVKKNLGAKPSRCRFKTHEKFAKDVRLVFQNALIYNKVDAQVKGSVYDAAQHLLRVFETAYAKSKETVFDDDDAAEQNSSTNEEHDAPRSESRAGDGDAAIASGQRDESGGATTVLGASSSSSSKHKKDKKEKKEKKSKKSKKKSKDKDKESSREKDKSKDKHRDKSSKDTKESSHKTAPSDLQVPVPTSALEPPVAKAAPSTTAVSTATSSGTDVSASGSSDKMSEELTTACLSVLMKLVKYKEGNVSPAAPFLQPVDLTHFPDYKVKVPNRMHLYGVQKKLRSGGYATLDAFAYDVRLVFSNCLVYNSDVVLSKVIRSHAMTLMKLFETQFAKIGGTWPGTHDRWKCHQVLHEILAHRTDGHETAQWFKYPIETYFDSPDQIPYGYFKTIKHPMDFGTVSSRLHLGTYKHASEFVHDLKLIFDNCLKYWTGDPQGVTYCDSARTLIGVLTTQTAAVLNAQVGERSGSKDKSTKSSSSSTKSQSSSSTSSKERKSSSSTSAANLSSTVPSASAVDEEKSRKRSSKHISTVFPEKDVALEILKLLRQHKMRGYKGVEIMTAGPFLHAVDIAKYPDYITIVSEPMDFAKIERKLKSDRYSDVNEFAADVHLIFTNCHKYNSDPVEGADIRAMASNLRDYFVALYNEKLGNGDKAILPDEPAIMPSARASLEGAPTSKSESQISSSSSRSTSAVAALQSPKAKVKTPSSSPPTRNSEMPVTSPTPLTLKSSERKPSTVSELSTPSDSGDVVPRLDVSGAASASSLTSSSTKDKSQMTPQELEEYRKKRKERKEKKDKKKKDKKEKKKKNKDKEKKDKSSRVSEKGASSSVVAAVQAVSTPSAQPPSLASSAPRSGHVASKIAPSDIGVSSKSKSKKSKKSDLSGWEASAERVLNRLGKIEQVAKLHFDKPLLEVFPQLELEYRRLVQEPMDLRTLREKLQSHSLVSASEFLRLGRLIFRNAIKFNCAPDLASVHVREMSAHLLWYFESLCAELKLDRESSSDCASSLEAMRRERAELVKTTPMEVKAKECQKLLRVLNSQKYDKNCWPFRKPVQVLFPTLSTEYFDIIKTPMDLATISEKLAACEYKVHGEFIDDVRLTFENAIKFNHADKDREGWNVYGAAVHMLAVVEEQWWDVTLDILERVRRKEILRKERDQLSEKRREDKRVVESDRHTGSATSRGSDSVDHSPVRPAKVSSSSRDTMDATFIAKASITIAPPSSSKDDPEAATKLKLQLVNRPNLDRMNKSERKAEEKRRKRQRREEEMAKSEKRRRTAVAATDDALREAELRSRRRLQKLEITEAIKQREERERQAREDEAAKALASKMKLNPALWTGSLAPSVPGSSFWLRKPAKLRVPVPFLAAVDC